MSFESDIYVFIYMDCVLVELIDKWVYGCASGGYLRFIYVGNLGVLSYNIW